MVSRHEHVCKGGEGEDHGGGEAGGQAGGAGDGAVLTVKYASVVREEGGKEAYAGLSKCVCLYLCSDGYIHVCIGRRTSPGSILRKSRRS